MIGTTTAHPKKRQDVKTVFVLSDSGAELKATPVIGFSNNQEWRYPNRTSGLIQIRKTAAPRDTLPRICIVVRGKTGRDTSQITQVADKMRNGYPIESGTLRIRSISITTA
jgi:hypothetical protein